MILVDTGTRGVTTLTLDSQSKVSDDAAKFCLCEVRLWLIPAAIRPSVLDPIDTRQYFTMADVSIARTQQSGRVISWRQRKGLKRRVTR